MKFVDLKTGNIYNGDIPYIHWFDDNQSTNLIYVKKLCVVDIREELSIELHSDVFKLIDFNRIESSQDVNINHFSYKNLKNLIVEDGVYNSTGFSYKLDNSNLYIHVIYITSSSSVEGEYLEDLYISDEKFTIGASFWSEYEPHKINLSNFGVEISEDVHRALYDTNIHEESVDYITLNRKRKELLMNYWNIIASKGSYRSLYDSLQWFEYGDLVKLKEMWNSNKNHRLLQQEILQVMSPYVKSYMGDYSKTTYFGLYAALNQLHVVDGKIQYEKKINLIDEIVNKDGEVIGALTHAILDESLPDDISMDQIFQIGSDDVLIKDDPYVEEEPEWKEYVDPSDWIRVTYDSYNGIIGEEVPELIKSITRWSAEDLSLKMYLLGNFYETYFMPIHLDLIHSTIEHIVFTNTLKILTHANICRQDYFQALNSFKCNIKDGECFYLENVSCQVNNDTKLGIRWEGQSEYSDIQPIGVDLIINNIDDDNELKTFMTQYYDGIGKIVDFDCELRVDDGDFIKKANIAITCLRSDSKYYRTGSFKLLCAPENDICKPSFKLLFEEHGDYHIALSFETAGNKIYTRNINISILDNSHRTLKVYKVMRNIYPEHENMIKPSDYIFSSFKNQQNNYIHNFVLASDIQNKTGVGFQRLLVYEINDNSSNIPSTLTDNFDIIRQTDRKDENNNSLSNYIYLLSKHFDKDDTDISGVSSDFGILKRDDYVYIPQNHHLEEITGNTLSDYQVTNLDTLMIIPDIKYLKKIEEAQWIVENTSTKHIVKPIEIKYQNRPYIANKDRILEKGFYNIKFRYLLGSDIQEICLDSAFQVI